MKNGNDLDIIGRILREARNDLQQMAEWAKDGDLDIALKYQHKAIALIEFVEVEHCGSVGGFGTFKGKKQSELAKYPRYQGLKGRLEWLEMVYLGEWK